MGRLRTALSDSDLVRGVLRTFFMLGDSVRPVVQRPIVSRFIGHEPIRRALDAGAGRGYYTRILLKRADEVAAIDYDAGHIATLRRRLGRLAKLELQVGSAADLPYPAESFDLVIHCEVLEHIEEDQKVVSELFRVLRPGGRLVLSVPVPPAPMPDPQHVREGYTCEQISQMLQAAGFVIKRHRYCMFKYSRAVMKMEGWWWRRFRFPPPTVFLLLAWWERWFYRGGREQLPYDVVIEAQKPGG